MPRFGGDSRRDRPRSSVDFPHALAPTTAVMPPRDVDREAVDDEALVVGQRHVDGAEPGTGHGDQPPAASTLRLARASSRSRYGAPTIGGDDADGKLGGQRRSADPTRSPTSRGSAPSRWRPTGTSATVRACTRRRRDLGGDEGDEPDGAGRPPRRSAARTPTPPARSSAARTGLAPRVPRPWRCRRRARSDPELPGQHQRERASRWRPAPSPTGRTCSHPRPPVEAAGEPDRGLLGVDDAAPWVNRYDTTELRIARSPPMPTSTSR